MTMQSLVLCTLVSAVTYLPLSLSNANASPVESQKKNEATLRVMTPHDVWAMKRVDNLVVSPDQKWIAYTVQTWSVEKNRATNQIWLMDTQGKNQRRLTTEEASDGAPAWSADGQRIAFTSKRHDDEASSLYVIAIDGGEAEKIIEVPLGVSNPQWLPNGKSIVFGTQAIPELKGSWRSDDLTAMKKEIKRRRDSKMTAKVTEVRTYRYFDHWLTDLFSSHLLKVDLDTKTLTDLTPASKQLFSVTGAVDYVISKDGQTIALSMNSAPIESADGNNSDIYLIALDGVGKPKNITPENKGSDSSAQFSPDGKFVYYVRQQQTFYDGSFSKLWRHELSSGQNSPVLQTPDYAYTEFSFSQDKSAIWTTVEDAGEFSVFKNSLDGQKNERVLRDGSISRVSQVGTRLIYLQSTFNRPNEIYSYDIQTKQRTQLTHYNDALMQQLKLGKVESYQFKGGNDDLVQAWLILPPDYDKSKKYPLLQLMHGGPHTMVANGFSFRWNAHLMAAPGYIVTWVNRHGSTGFGEAYARSITNQWGVMPTQDILRSTDYLIEKLGNVDTQKIAAAGASYGGYMAAWLAGHTDRFVTIVNHAGVNDFIAQYGSDVTNSSFEKTLGGAPWSNLEGMNKNNPSQFAKNFKTPMLITHGQLDYRVPYANSTALYGILQSMKVPSRLVIFPNENHWILNPQNSIYWNWEVQTWLQRYIGGTPTLKKPEF